MVCTEPDSLLDGVRSPPASAHKGFIHGTCLLHAELALAGQQSMLNRSRRIYMGVPAEQVPEMADSKVAPVMLHHPCNSQSVLHSIPRSGSSQRSK